MADPIGAPSFSLGLDFDFDSDTDTKTQPPDLVVPDSDSDNAPDPLPRVGEASSGNAGQGRIQLDEFVCIESDNNDDDDDDIEEFSQDEEDSEGLPRGAQPATLPRSVCSSSKVPLKANGILTPQVSTRWTSRNRTQVSDAIPSEGSKSGCNKSKRPKLASSPLRMFQLIDSDSDDPVGEDRDSDLIGEFTKASGGDKNGAKEFNSDDLWKGFPLKSSHVPTPAFDEVFKEYFHSEKNKSMPHKPVNSISTGVDDVDYQKTYYNQNTQQECNSSDSVPPAHKYFLHDDPRIQNLVRSRFPNFLPLGVSNNRGNMQASTSVINYMSQFGSGESSKRDKTVNSRAKGNSMAGRNKRKKTQIEEVSKASGNWVNPKNSGTLPKDAGKRRVHADGQSAGHWYTGPDGKKVYVTKNGQELTGQVAYRHYRKESGAGSKRSRKKTSSKKKRSKG